MKNKITKTLLALTLSGAMCVTPFTASAAKSSMALAGTSTSFSGISISTDASGKITNMGSSISNIGYASGGNSTGISYGADGNTNFGCYSGGTSTMAYTGISTSKKAVMCSKHGGKTHVYGRYEGQVRAKAGDKLKVYGIKVNGKYYKIGKNGYCNASYDEVSGQVSSKFNGKVGKISYICLADMQTTTDGNWIKFTANTDLTVKAPALSKGTKADVQLVLNKYSDANPKGTVISMKLTNVGVSGCKTKTVYTDSSKSSHKKISKCRYSGKVVSSKTAKHTYKNKKCTACGRKK